ncbi:MAG TPA: tetratricopeptide repeat protein, partial [Thermoanaerobaculia bacterium]|nr:tetratricopeptide repeat protein [Thermoanaerobaculia bacterium]
MCRSGADRRGRARGPLVAAALLAALAAVAPPAAAQGVTAAAAPELTPPVEQSLSRLQEGWLQWTGAFYGGDPERAREVADDLVATAGQLGMRRLPDLAAGALVQAVEAAREGEAERSALALEVAERLDPGRPEIAFAAADAALLARNLPAAVVAQARGWLRLPRMGLEWRITLHGLFLWGLASLLLAAGLFAALLMGVRGPALVQDLERFLARHFRALPTTAVWAVAAVLLLWPLVLPAGVLWLALYWSLLLWGYTGAGGRAVLVVAWVLLGTAPVVVTQARERVALALSPPVRALESVARDRLYGGLFTDLSILPGALPDEPAVDHFFADLHVRLDQWDDARRHYEAVLEEEPENVDALVNLGAYYFDRSDFGNAVALFQQAAALAGHRSVQAAAAHFDLSIAYAESYLYDEQREALLEARRIDDLRVSRWMQRPERNRIVTVEGGVARIGEIEDALRAEWSPPSEVSRPLRLLRRGRPAILIALLAAVAAAFHAVRGARAAAP